MGALLWCARKRSVTFIGKCHIEGTCRKLNAGELLASDTFGTHKNRPHSIPEEVKQQI